MPVTEKTKPNLYLADIPERDIKTPSGKWLTLMNPAYMSRQVYELEKEVSILRGHITSLNPIRAENKPDPWEVEALKAFERGEMEINSVEKMEGQEYLRLMRPLITEKGCLECHAKQGYKENDIRGGISVSIPMKPLWTVSSGATTRLALIHAIIWLMGIGGIAFGTVHFRKSEQRRSQAEEALHVAQVLRRVRKQGSGTNRRIAKSQQSLTG